MKSMPLNTIPSSQRQPGRPQDETIHRAALKAVLEILGEQGFDKLTFETVAARAGTSRPALYRRWKNKEILIAEALESQRAPLTVPNTGSLRSDLRQAADDFIVHFATPLGRQAILDILRANVQHNPSAQAWQAAYGLPRQDSFRMVFTRAIKQGELSPSSDISTMMFILSAVLLHTCLLGSTDRPQLDSVIDFVIDQAN